MLTAGCPLAMTAAQGAEAEDIEYLPGLVAAGAVAAIPGAADHEHAPVRQSRRCLDENTHTMNKKLY